REISDQADMQFLVVPDGMDMPEATEYSIARLFKEIASHVQSQSRCSCNQAVMHQLSLLSAWGFGGESIPLFERNADPGRGDGDKHLGGTWLRQISARSCQPRLEAINHPTVP